MDFSELSLGVSRRLEKPKDLNLWEVLSLNHCIVPLLFISIVRKISFIEGSSFSMFLSSPDLETTISVKEYSIGSMERIMEKGTLDSFLDPIWENCILNNFFTQNNFSKENLHIVGYLNKRQFYKDYFLLFDQIPQI